MMTRTVQTGVVAEYKGKYWGKQYGDGKCTVYGYGPIENAKVSDPEYCLEPRDMTYRGSRDEQELNKATLLPFRETITYEVANGN